MTAPDDLRRKAAKHAEDAARLAAGWPGTFDDPLWHRFIVGLEEAASTCWADAVAALLAAGDLTVDEALVAVALSENGWVGTLEDLVRCAQGVAR